MVTFFKENRPRLLFTLIRTLFVLAFLGPFLGRVGIHGLALLVVLMGLGAYLAGVLLASWRPEEPRLYALGEGLFTGLALRPLAGLVGAEFGWPASLFFGLVTGVLSFLWLGAERDIAGLS